jgi:hypothetical protein
MTTITLAGIEAAQQKLADMIAGFKAQVSRFLTIVQAQVELKPGEHYAGIILGADGLPAHHLILLPSDAEDVSWDKAKTFAAEVGGELPTRSEQALLFANLKGQFEQRYYWSGEQHAAIDVYAWSGLRHRHPERQLQAGQPSRSRGPQITDLTLHPFSRNETP